jgi:NAD(P)-dependent dehydrogenase (short-subunit alcohol dehydrogenase family)
MVHLTKTLAKELGKDNITINCVCPGIVRTPMHETYHRNETELEAFYAKRGAAFPLGRVGEPRDVAGAIRFFLGDDAAWVTGDVLVVDGGRLLL